MQVSYNGYIVLWPKRPKRKPVLPKLPPTIKLRVPFIAPFWADMARTTSKYHHVYVRVIGGRTSRLAKAVRWDIKKKFKINYNSKRLLIVSWLRVHYAGGLKDRKKVRHGAF